MCTLQSWRKPCSDLAFCTLWWLWRGGGGARPALRFDFRHLLQRKTSVLILHLKWAFCCTKKPEHLTFLCVKCHPPPQKKLLQCSKQLAHTTRPLPDRFLINRWTLMSLFCLYKGVYFIPQNHAWPNFAAANMCVFVMAPLCWRGFQRCLDREGCWADGTESSLTSQQTQDPPPLPRQPSSGLISQHRH